MRPIQILSILLLYSVNIAFGQESERYLKLKLKQNYHEGYIIKWDSAKIEGLVKANTNEKDKDQYSMVIFFTMDGSETRYKPYEVKEYGYGTEMFVSDYGSFYKVVLNGKRAGTYVKWISLGIGAGAMNPNNGYTQRNLYIRKNDKYDFRHVTRKGFNEEFSEYLGDCEKLKLKIQSKEVTYKDIEAILLEYNNCR